MTIRETKLANGERFVFFADAPFLAPDPWITAYTVAILRPRGLAANTVHNHLAGIKAGLIWFQGRHGSDLRTFLGNRIFGDEDLGSLASACRTGLDGSRTLSAAPGRYTAFVAYCLWLRSQAPGRTWTEADGLAQDAFFAQRAALFRPKPTSADRHGVRLGLTDDQRELFLRVIRPDNIEENPFWSTRYRNFVMLSLSFQLGLRTGEILCIRVKDLDIRTTAPTVTVRCESDDPREPRGRAPACKTVARTLPLSDELADACLVLIKERRRSRTQVDVCLQSGARRSAADGRDHGFLFCNRHGGALSDRAFRKVFNVLKERHPSLSPIVNHVLRHDWNDRWTAWVKAAGRDPTRSGQEQRLLQGWSPNSKMPQRYSKTALASSARESSLEVQRLSILRNGSGASL